tara:strand:- start:2010 stop:3275 length:1266 start_codon:yes stop_codon:yes gene_type:complete
MSVVLPKKIDYSEILPALPDNSTCVSNVISPANGSVFSPSSIVQFDLGSTNFLVPESLSLRYTYKVTSAGGSEMVGVPALAPFSRFETIMGSQVCESIQNYNQVATLISNLSMSVAEKYGQQASLGYKSTGDATAVTLDELDGRLMIANEEGSFSSTLPCMLSYSEKLIPMFALPSVRIQLTLDSLANIFTSGASSVIPTAFEIANVELCYRTVNMGGEVEAMIRGMGDQIFIKSQSFVNSAQYLASSTSGQFALIFNQRLASVKSAFVVGAGTHATSLNKWGDSFAISSTGDYQLNIGGISYPQRPLRVDRQAGVMQELREAVGSIYDRKNSLSVNRVEFDRVNGDTSTCDQPAKFYVGVNLEKLSSGSLLTGISTANSPISLLINSPTATSQALNMHLILNYDALLQINPTERTVQVLM